MGLIKMLLDDNPRNVKKLGKIADKVEEKGYLYAKMSEEELKNSHRSGCFLIFYFGKTAVSKA